MIGMTLNGRLGNQLFQYAFAFALSEKYHTFYVIDNKYKVDCVKKYFRVPNFSNNKISRELFRKWIAPKIPFVEQGINEQVDEILPRGGNNHFYQGFFQSELFFYNAVNIIHRRFRVRQRHIKTFHHKYGHLFKNKILAIHYRLGDYLTWGNERYGGVDMTLPESYYRNALQQINNIDDYTIVIVTDDKKNIVSKLRELKNKIIISDDEIIDFQVLLNADMIISSNSSFCWWAAYLNQKGPTIFAPRYWLGFKVNEEMPSQVIPAKFTRVDIN